MYFTYVFQVFLLREPCKKTTATGKAKILLSSIRKVINSRFPDLFFKLNELTDSRKRKEYMMDEIITGSLFMYIFKETSRNAYNNNRREDGFRENVLK